MLRELLPPDVIVVAAEPEMWSVPLHPDEELLVRKAVEKRRREFAAGRACARRALEQLGVADFVLCANGDRSPRWPEGILGSITHSASYCAAAVCRRGRILGLGIDVEAADRIEENLVDWICSPLELKRGRSADVVPASVVVKLIFSAKESVFKSYYPATKKLLGFHDVEIEQWPDRNSFVARLADGRLPSLEGRRVFRGRYAVTADYVVTAVAVD